MAIRPEKLLISLILTYKNREGLTKESFGPDNLTRYKDELFFILNASQIPSKKLFSSKFPRFRFVKTTKSDLPTLIKLCRDNKIRQDVVISVRKAAEDIRNGIDPHEIALSTQRSMGAASNQFTPTVDVDVFSSIDSYMDLYKEKRRLVRKGLSIGIPYGLSGIDKVTGGMQPKEMITIASRTSIGKTFIKCLLTASALINGKSACFFSLEMSFDQIAARIFTILSYRLQKGDPKLSEILFNSKMSLAQISTKKMYRILERIRKQISGKLIVPDITGTFSIEQAGRKIDQHEPDLALFDYFGLAVGDTGKIDNWMAAADSSHKAKEISRTYNIPFVVGAQLNRSGVSTPSINSIAITDSIGQDSDKVYILTSNRPGKLRISCQKFRGGSADWSSMINWKVDIGKIEEIRFISGSGDDDEEED
jgi:hypothetical protein